MTTAEQLVLALKLFAALGCGLVAGVFFAFSSFVMSALSRLPAAQGVAAMQLINIRVLNPLFLGVFLGTAAACVALAAISMLRPQPGAAFLLAGSLLYLVGTFGVTVVFNVPLNDALATLQPDDVEASSRWAAYVSGWTAWNHVRTVAALAAAAAIVLGISRSSP